MGDSTWRGVARSKIKSGREVWLIKHHPVIPPFLCLSLRQRSGGMRTPASYSAFVSLQFPFGAVSNWNYEECSVNGKYCRRINFKFWRQTSKQGPGAFWPEPTESAWSPSTLLAAFLRCLQKACMCPGCLLSGHSRRRPGATGASYAGHSVALSSPPRLGGGLCSQGSKQQCTTGWIKRTGRLVFCISVRACSC